ncbi:nucleotidyl transferase AbiEii/AbiGii toxin family protein [Sulfurimonas sp.]|jgi:predicted nucleotidyltransferase component of viral defense system|uniref:nucleotidyl transferase AbiEii/AbiGii toxin family protein n=1 Tax=Sulfurimonas sp. TaxID=2022749 RepID=UPI002A371E58|nr:nucleotidyl transferase AbiEii/AbiGii toxin family protein [Sulfurimonas sp.]MDY0123886.1 nucleotidyl transferase AbiEii/AbiGii toxin family protein [Sulfurimonas sp.]
MTHPALIKMLEKYDLRDSNASFDALREILQEIVLLGLYDAGFFKHAAFYGGTALRILHNLPRFSEDLDFSLLESNPKFNLKPYEEAIISTLKAFGFDVTIEIKEKNNSSAIASAFVKGNTIEHLININAPKDITSKIHRDQAVKIKLEVDTNPPLDFEIENIIRLTPRPFSINAFTLPSLYAGKMHAILCRAWSSRPKGRDWYDMVWYIANDVELDTKHLKARLSQSCKYLEANEINIPDELTKQNIKELLLQRIESLDVGKAKNDVQPFIKDMREIELWSKEFFIAVVENIKIKGE